MTRTWRELEQMLFTYFQSHGCWIGMGDGDFSIEVTIPGDTEDDLDTREEISLSDLARELTAEVVQPRAATAAQHGA